MYVRRLAGSGMARNFVSHSRSVWLERGGDPASEGGSAASKEDGSSRQKTNNTAAERRIEFLSKGIGSLIIDGRSGISIRCFFSAFSAGFLSALCGYVQGQAKTINHEGHEGSRRKIPRLTISTVVRTL